MEIIKGKVKAPYIILIYGVPGVGKSELATFADKPLFLDVENGLDRIDCHKTPVIETWDKLLEAMRFAYDSDYKTVVVDTLVALELLLVNKILKEYNDKNKSNVESLSDKIAFPYGAGYFLLQSNWALFTKMVFKLKAKGKNVVLVAHETIEKVENPSGENFDRTTINVHKKSAPSIVSNVDAVFYAKYSRFLRSKSEGSDEKIAVSNGDRILQVVESATCIAKNRFGLNEDIVFNTDKDRKALFKSLEK